MADNKTTTNSTNNNPKSENTAEVKDKTEATEAQNTAENVSEPEPEPSLRDDYEALKNMNILRNVMIRAQYGKYPNKKIDAVLKRRMDLDESKFQGPRLVRAIITIMSLFIFCTLVYVGIFLLSKAMNLQGVAESASLVLSLFFISGLGFAIFNNFSVPDEKKLKILIKERMTELEIELNIEHKNEDEVDNGNASKQEK